jgi:Flp pilus assembly pilin Flp
MFRLVNPLRIRILLSYLRSQRGASAIEYALIASVIAVGLAAALSPVRDAIVNVFADVLAEFGGGEGGGAE